MQTLKPTKDNLKIKVEKKKDRETSSGIITSVQGNDILEQGVVEAAGPDATHKAGETVFFKDYTLDKITTADLEEHYFVNEKDVIAYV